MRISKVGVITNFRSPNDPSGKARYAVVLDNKDKQFLIAPCTTYPERTGIVPPGNVLLSDRSPAYAGSGFSASRVAIDIRAARWYPSISKRLVGVTVAGILDVRKDSTLKDEFEDFLEAYDVEHSPVQWD